jgi:AcrR family transcriptional regulator
VTRQTVYRYFPGTQALLVASAMRSADGFLDRMAAHLEGVTDPVVAITEGMAFAVEELASDNQVEFVLNQRHRGAQKVSIISDTALAFGRSMLHRYDIDWEHYGFDEAGLDELNEFSLRVLHSFLADPGRPPRSGADLRRYLTRWIGPAIAYPQLVRAMDALGTPEPQRTRRRPSKAS